MATSLLPLLRDDVRPPLESLLAITFASGDLPPPLVPVPAPTPVPVRRWKRS